MIGRLRSGCTFDFLFNFVTDYFYANFVALRVRLSFQSILSRGINTVDCKYY